MRNKKQRAKRVSPMVMATRIRYAHRDSVVVEKARQLAEFQLSQAEDSVIALRAAVARELARMRDLRAELEGIALVLERR